MDEQVKDPTTIDEQIHILSERGMQVDADLARQWRAIGANVVL